MEGKRLTYGETRLMQLIWDNEPLPSSRLTEICLRELGSVHDVVDRDQVIAVADGEPGIRVIDDCPVIIIFRRLDG